MVHIHASRAAMLSQLLSEPDDVARSLSQLMTFPQILRRIINLATSSNSWRNLTLTQCTAPCAGNPLFNVVVDGQLEQQKVKLIISGDPLDVEAAANPRPETGTLFTSADVTPSVASLLEVLLSNGFRFRPPLNPEQARWHEYQLGRQPKPYSDPAPRPNREHGLLCLLIGKDSEQALQVQIAWGDGVEKLFLQSVSVT